MDHKRSIAAEQLQFWLKKFEHTATLFNDQTGRPLVVRVNFIETDCNVVAFMFTSSGCSMSSSSSKKFVSSVSQSVILWCSWESVCTLHRSAFLVHYVNVGASGT